MVLGGRCRGRRRRRSTGGDEIVAALRRDGIRVWAHDARGVAEEAPGAYKDVERVVAAAETAGLNRAVARLRPMAVIKG